jgi:hypothetical protein
MKLWARPYDAGLFDPSVVVVLLDQGAQVDPALVANAGGVFDDPHNPEPNAERW